MTDASVCWLCGAGSFQPLFRTHDRLVPGPEQYWYLRCQGCGLIGLWPQPSWSARSPHYAASYRGYQRLATESSPIRRLSMRYGLAKRFRLIKRRRRGGRLLDVGCAGGDFIAWLKTQPNWQGYGLERVPLVAQAAHTSYAVPVCVSDLHQPGLAPASFDVLTLWTVLEHLDAPAAGLQACATLLRPGGLLIVRTVQQESWARRVFGPNWVGYDAPRITTVFSRANLQRLLAQTGFRIEQTGSWFHDFYPLLWSWQNACAALGLPPWFCHASQRLLGSLPVRLLSYPWLRVQTALGGTSFVTIIARKA
ncbi:MAG: class I SAM-dependent methyltransferase [Oscillochloridaceae bacterium umkhey_bin13]